MTGKTGSNIPILDSMRAFAALSVCLYHFVCTTTGYVKTDWILNLFSVGKNGVQTFFVISGFVIPWSMYHGSYKLKNFAAFFLKRVSRLEPPYIFSIILVLIILFLREKLLGKQNDHIEIGATQVFLHFGYLIPFFEGYQWLNQVYWTLAVEFQFYILIALLFIPLTTSNTIIRLLIYSACILVSFIGSSQFLPFWLPFFLLGIVLFLLKTERISKMEFYSVSLLVILFCFIKYPIASIFYSLIPFVMVLFWQDLKIFGLHFLGKISYSIYLIHPLLGGSLINILSHRYNDPVSKFLVIVSGIIITLGGAWLMYKIIERPSKILSASIKYSKPEGGTFS